MISHTMATLTHLCLPLIMFLLPLRGEPISCGKIDIHFPFGFKGANNQTQTQTRFHLSCDIKVNDPEGCLPKRFLHNLSLSLHPPFTFDATVYYLTFLRCPSNLTNSRAHPIISCLTDSNSNSSWVVFSWRDECAVISSAIPNPDTTTSFFEPACGDCAGRGQVCGFTGDTSLQVGCFSTTPNNESQVHAGLSRSAKYGLTVGVGIPGLLCLTGLCCFMCSKFDVYAHRHRARPRTELPNMMTTLPPSSFIMGLDGLDIENLPKTLIGESGRLPNSSDNTCPICLSEYEPKETLRTIPTCSHYFHAHCIDEWLLMNATCPLCRNSPDASSAATPSSSFAFVIDNPSVTLNLSNE